MQSLSGTVVDGQGESRCQCPGNSQGRRRFKNRPGRCQRLLFIRWPSCRDLRCRSVIASGFSSASKGGVTLAAGQSQQIDPLPLTIASVEEQIDSQRRHRICRGRNCAQRRLCGRASRRSHLSLTPMSRTLRRQSLTSAKLCKSFPARLPPAAMASDSAKARPTSAASLTVTSTSILTAFRFTIRTLPRITPGRSSRHSGSVALISTAAPDRLPTIGPTPFGGSIHLLSKPVGNESGHSRHGILRDMEYQTLRWRLQLRQLRILRRREKVQFCSSTYIT